MTSHAGPSSLLRRLWHRSSSDMTIAEGDHEFPVNNSEDPPAAPKHDLSGDRAVNLDQTPAGLNEISDMPNTGAELPIAGSGGVFSMSNIEAMDEAPIAPDCNQTGLPFTMSNIEILDVAPTAAVRNVVEGSSRNTGERGPAVQNAPSVDESWIPVPYVFNLTRTNQHSITNTLH